MQCAVWQCLMISSVWKKQNVFSKMVIWFVDALVSKLNEETVIKDLHWIMWETISAALLSLQVRRPQERSCLICRANRYLDTNPNSFHIVQQGRCGGGFQHWSKLKWTSGTTQKHLRLNSNRTSKRTAATKFLIQNNVLWLFLFCTRLPFSQTELSKCAV